MWGCRRGGAPVATLRTCGVCEGVGFEETGRESRPAEEGCERCRDGMVVECVRVVEEWDSGGEGDEDVGVFKGLRKSYYPLVRKATAEEVMGIDVKKELHRVV